MTPTIRSLTLLIGLLVLLLGLYGAIRTVINMVVFDKYPTGVININFNGVYSTYNLRESDCYNFQPTPSYDVNGMPIPGSENENMLKQQVQCIKGQDEDRANAKINDIATSLMFVFVGKGLILAVKSSKLSKLLS